MTKVQPITGIYKITSPSGRVYIGQSRHIKRRWREIKNSRIKNSELPDSFKQHGYSNHSFEIIHELPKDVDRSIMHEYEILYIDLHRNAGFDLFNISDGGRLVPEWILKNLHEKNTGRTVPDEVRERIRKTMTGVKHTPERIEAGRIGRIGKMKRNKGSYKVGEGAKLTKQQADEIRAKYVPREYSFRKLAKEYGVHDKTIRTIIAKTYKCYQ